MAYKIDLSEGQRALLVFLLEEMPMAVRQAAAAEAPESLERENIAALLSGLRGLPEAEAEHPGVLHGLCL